MGKATKMRGFFWLAFVVLMGVGFFGMFGYAMSNNLLLQGEDIRQHKPRLEYFYVSVRSNFIVGEPVKAHLCGSEDTTVEVSLYAIESFDVLLSAVSGLDSENVKKIIESSTPIKTFTATVGGKCEELDLEVEKPGVYVIYVKNNSTGKTDFDVFWVESVSLLLKAVGDKGLVYVSDTKNGLPLSGVELKLYKVDRSRNTSITANPVELGHTDERGMLTWTIQEDEKASNSWVVVARSGEHFGVGVTFNYRYETRFLAYVFTDRPIYRPNQRVHFKAIVWDRSAREAVSNERVRITIEDPKGIKILDKEYVTNEFGSISDSLVLSDEPPLGYYRIVVNQGDYYLGSASFEVEEYRKPEFEVKVIPSKKVFVGGEKARIEIKAEYFFKMPVQNAEVMYEVYEYSHHPPCYRYWGCVYYSSLTVADNMPSATVISDEISTENEMQMPAKELGMPSFFPSNLVTKGITQTDASGRAFIEFDTNATAKRRYVVRVGVADQSNRMVEVSKTVYTAPAALYLTITPSKWMFGKDENVVLHVGARDFDQNPVDTEVKLKVYRVAQDHVTGKKNRELVEEKTVVTQEGTASVSFRLDEGRYFVEAFAEDKMGNKTSANIYVAVGVYEYNNKQADVKVTFDKEYYRVGEQAVLIIDAPKDDYYALITIEGRELYTYELVHATSRKFFYVIDVKEEYEPNVYVKIAGLIDGKPFYKGVILKVPPVEKKITLSISTDKNYYLPGETARYTVKTMANGRPVQAEFAIALVDEAIFSLASSKTPDVFSFLFPPQYNLVSTYWNVKVEIYFYTPEFSPVPAIKRDVGEGYAAPTVRKRFEDTAFWRAYLMTNEQGIAEFEVKLPDNLTTWRATVIANNKNQVGMQQDKIAVTKNLLVRLANPRFMVVDDELELIAIVHNSLPEMKDVLVRVNSEELEFLDGPQKEITVASGKSETVSFKVRVKRCCKATIRVDALTDVESDALEIVLPVLPWGVKNFTTISGVTQSSIEYDIKFPQKSLPESDKLIVSLEPTLASVLVNSLEYLTGYPYGCIEQTMSRFLPDVVVVHALKELGIENKKLEEKLPDMVEKGLQRIYNFQQYDGGWGWWRSDQSQPQMTAYVMYGLTLAKKYGFDVSENVFDQGMRKMISEFNSISDRELQAFISYVLYLNGDTRFVQKVKEHADEMSPYGKALLVLQLDSKSEAQPYLNQLADEANCDAAFCSWTGKSWRTYWSTRNVDTTAVVLRAFLKFEPEHESVLKAVKWLTSTREYYHWRSTYDTAMAIMALTEYLSRLGELKPQFTAKLYVNGELKKVLEVTPENVLEQNFRLILENIPKTSTVKIEMEGKGALYYTITKEYVMEEEVLNTAENGIKITRDVNRVIDIGQEVKVRLRIDSNREYEYVIVEDYLPAGVSVVDTRIRSNYGYYWEIWRPYWFARKEVRDEKVVFFFRTLRQGVTEVDYTIRGELAGTYKHLPALVYLMYNPEVNGRSSGSTLTVTSKRRFALPQLSVKGRDIWVQAEPLPEAVIGARIVDSEGNEIGARVATVSNDGIMVIAENELPEGAYSLKLLVDVNGEEQTISRDFQVGRVEVERPVLEDVSYYDDLSELFGRRFVLLPPVEDKKKEWCLNTGGRWEDDGCVCPGGHVWVFGTGCEELREEKPIPVPSKDGNTLLIIVIAIMLVSVLAFVLYRKRIT